MIDGLGADPVERATILIEHGTITSAGPAESVRIPRGAEILDASGHTVLPGIIDCHVHCTYRARDIRRHLLNTPTYNILRSTQILEDTLACGVTTARDMGGADHGFRQAVDEGLIAGPRLFVCLVMISQTGGHGDQWVPAGFRIGKRAWLPDAVADGVDGMRRKVREILMAGADFIKVCTGGGITSITDNWDEPQFSVEELRVAVGEAAARGRRVAAHAEGLEPIRNALKAGVYSIEHGWFLDEECIDTMLRQGTWWIPTLALVPLSIQRRNADEAWSRQQMGEEDRKDSEIHERMKGQMHLWQEAHRRGVKIAMGTDQSHRLLVGENLVELGFMVKCLGMSSLQAIAAATSRAAACLERADLGAIEAGRAADLIAVSTDPLVDIESLGKSENVRLVMKAGRIYRNELE